MSEGPRILFDIARNCDAWPPETARIKLGRIAEMIENPTTTTLRCFVAIASPLTEAAWPLVDELEGFASNEEFRLRLVPTGNLHITLKFVGSVDTDQVGLLDSILRNQSAKQAALNLKFRGIGFFKNSLYMGIEENDALNQFVSNLNEAFTFLGYPIEEMKFLPHITLARFQAGGRSELTARLEAYCNKAWGNLIVESFQLFRSETLPEGARYTPIRNYPLLA